MPLARAIATATATACALSATALAASSYSVDVHTPSSVKEGHPFTVKTTGSAKKQAELYVFLDRKKCLSDETKEAERDAQYKNGHSYFALQGEGGTFKSPYFYAVVKGKFTQKPKAHAGSKTGEEHACAYLLSKDKFGNYSNTAARAHHKYTVTKS